MAKGKSDESNKPSWLKLSDKDIEAIIVKLAKQEITSEKIGLELRDTYGLPTTKVTGKKVSQILKENNLYQDPTLSNLEKKEKRVISHLGGNKQDKRAKRAMTITKARIAKYKKYKKRKDVKPAKTDGKRISEPGSK